MAKRRLDILDRARELMEGIPSPDYTKQILIDHVDNLNKIGSIRHQLQTEFGCDISTARNAITRVIEERREAGKNGTV